jgi:hypothetical protein
MNPRDATQHQRDLSDHQSTVRDEGQTINRGIIIENVKQSQKRLLIINFEVGNRQPKST